MTLINYNRALLTNLNNVTIPVPNTELLLLEFGLNVTEPVNFVELLSTVNWVANPTSATVQPTLELIIKQDGQIVGSALQESAPDAATGEDTPILELSSFQTILTNVPVGHHVYQLYARSQDAGQGTIIVFGPVNTTGKVIATENNIL